MEENNIGKWEGYKNFNHYFWLRQRKEWMKEVFAKPLPVEKKYYNVACSFDIETSSYIEYGQKKATMYVWSFCLNGSTILGRTWKEFVDFIDFLAKRMETNKYGLIIYVHNLSYEFQWMRGWFKWKDVFATKERRAIHATLYNGIEFKCSYILSNYALAYIGENLTKRYPVQKDVGALDYSKVRHSETPLSEEEVWYSAHDVMVVVSYIQQKIEDEGGIHKIPLTNTGYVRIYAREYSFTQLETDKKLRQRNKARYHELMSSLEIVSKGEYEQLHQAFSGGFTHAAPKWSGKTIE